MKRNICVITGSRAEWGLLFLLWKKLEKTKLCQLSLIVTGSHFSSEFGNTVSEIEAQNIKIDKRVILENNDIFTDTSQVFSKLPNAVKEIKPDLVIVLGDRYEILAASIVCCILHVPVAHISGGELTIGAIDDCFRHSITKMSRIHFTATEEYRKRVIQLGEEPEFVFNTGDIALSDIDNYDFLARSEIFSQLNLDESKKVILCTLHPETNDPQKVVSGLHNLFLSLDEMASGYEIVFTGANSDPGGREINKKIQQYTCANKNKHFFLSLGRKKYLSLARESVVVIGNSSSGIIEIPSLKVATVDIGDRQKGRLRAESVVHSDFSLSGLKTAISKAIESSCNKNSDVFENPYYNGDSAQKISELCLKIDLDKLKQPKVFYDL